MPKIAGMNYADLIKYFESQGAAARALGISQPSVCDWQDKGIPLTRQLEIELLTKGKLRADISEDLRRVLARKKAAA
jgi:DNA-binding transcriptional regulator YdaS (Cro superfamily)